MVEKEGERGREGETKTAYFRRPPAPGKERETDGDRQRQIKRGRQTDRQTETDRDRLRDRER